MSKWLRLITREGYNPTTGFDVYGTQPRGLTAQYGRNFERGFMAPDNVKMLQRRVYEECNGAVSLGNLMPVMDEAVAWYANRVMEQSYGPEDGAQVRDAVRQMNEFVMNRMRRRYVADRMAQDRYYASLHQPFGWCPQGGVFDRDLDKSIDMFPLDQWSAPR